MLCAHCGSQIPGTSRFCTRCGTRVIEDAHARNSEADAKTQLSDETMRRGGNGDPLIGRAFEDKYRIESRLGTGGMGTVYSATRLLIGDSVAIKVLHPELVADSQAVERFRREAQAAARLKHSNAVAIYDFGTSRDGKVYIIMEMVEGESLRNIIQRRAPLDQSLAAEIISQVCAALDEAHRHDIVHRDIKPDNIVVTETTRGLRVKVLDFGIAKLLDLSTTTGVLTQTGVAVGTPYYMSPEQCMGEELDGRSDIYSIGIVLYEMLSGVVPFNSPTPTAVIVQQVTQPPPPLHAINVDILRAGQNENFSREERLCGVRRPFSF
ncbi:MAG: serine/threonine protein kinase, partial [Blastocatellia bacterium]|nr:serine/threonine protein kinase [Blastocatellia bacterium]